MRRGEAQGQDARRARDAHRKRGCGEDDGFRARLGDGAEETDAVSRAAPKTLSRRFGERFLRRADGLGGRFFVARRVSSPRAGPVHAQEERSFVLRSGRDARELGVRELGFAAREERRRLVRGGETRVLHAFVTRHGRCRSSVRRRSALEEREVRRNVAIARGDVGLRLVETAGLVVLLRHERGGEGRGDGARLDVFVVFERQRRRRRVRAEAPVFGDVDERHTVVAAALGAGAFRLSAGRFGLARRRHVRRLLRNGRLDPELGGIRRLLRLDRRQRVRLHVTRLALRLRRPPGAAREHVPGHPRRARGRGRHLGKTDANRSAGLGGGPARVAVRATRDRVERLGIP